MKKIFLIIIILSSVAFAKAQTVNFEEDSLTDNNNNILRFINVKINPPSPIITDTVYKQNVTQHGGSDGVISFAVSGGTPFKDSNGNIVEPAYTVSLERGNTSYPANINSGYDTVNSKFTFEFSGLVEGSEANSYRIKVEDANGCIEYSSNIDITEPQPLIFNDSVTDITQPICNGDVGSITVRAQGGIANYQYQLLKETTPGSNDYENEGPAVIRNPTTNFVATNLDPANYRIKVTDNNGNGDATLLSEVIPITDVSPVIFSLGTPTDVSCLNGSDGSIFVTVSGGSGTYNYSWTKSNDSNFSSSSQNLENVTAGTYTLNVKDTNDCAGTVPMGELSIASIREPTSTITTSSTPTPIIIDPTSPGAMDGSIDIMFTGGTPKTTGAPYDYQWRKNGSTAILFTTRVISALDAGIYEVTVIDENGCEEVFEETLEDPLQLVVAIQENAAISCNGGTGSLKAIGSGGTSYSENPYKYQWFNITSGSPVDTGITAAIASNLIEGKYQVVIKDSVGITAQATFEFGDPDPLSFLISNSLNVSCYAGTDGAASVSVTGGNGDDNYKYIWSKTGDVSFSASTANITNLSAGTYTIRVEDTEGGSDCFITTTFEIRQPPSEVRINLDNQTDVLINDQNTGSIEVSVTGGAENYTYKWSKTGDPSFNETTKDITNVTAGTYTLEVKDLITYPDAGDSVCSTFKSFEITEPDPLYAEVVITNNVCYGEAEGLLTAIVTGGNTDAPYEYQWQIFQSDVYVNLSSPSSNTYQLENVIEGKYKLIVKDSNDARFITNTIDVKDPDELDIVNITPKVPDCFEASTGRINVDIIGGTPPYVYSWKNENNIEISTSKNLIDVPEGTYQLSVSDSFGCDEITPPITLEDPDGPLKITEALLTKLTGYQTSDGAIDLTITGGRPPYKYEWTHMDNPLFNATSQDIRDLQEGTYKVKITDSTECTLLKSFYIKEPDLLEIIEIVETNKNQCHGDNTTDLEAMVMGGWTPYSYRWFANDDPTNILSRTNALSNTYEGLYTLEVQDSANIVVSRNDIYVAAPSSITVENTFSNITCYNMNDGVISINVTGGTPFTTGEPYKYIWNTGDTTPTINDLSEGVYTVTITDANNCQTTFSKSLVPPNRLSLASSQITDASGYGIANGAITVEIIGGTGEYSYYWRDSNGTIIGSTATLTNLIGNTSYSLVVNDSNNCSFEKEFPVGEPDPLLIELDQNDITCYGGTGSLEAIPKGGVSPYNYSWLDANGIEISTSSNTGNIVEGIYSINIEDSKGNSVSLTTDTLVNPEILAITSTETDVSCYNARDGIINLNVTGGSGIYDISWNHDTNNTGLMASGLSGGTYTVTIVDQLDTSCILTESFTIQEPQPYGINNIIVTTPSSSNNDGSISLNVFGGIAPFTYNWRDENGTIISSSVGAAATSISNLPEGDYILTITDSSPFSCAITNTFTLGLPGELLVDIEQTNSVSCFGGNDGEITVTTNTGVNTFTWYDASFNPPVPLSNLFTSIVQVPAGTYYVEVYDAVQSITEISAPIVITEPDAVIASASSTEVKCFDQSDGTITIVAEGGNSAYEYVYRLVGSSYPISWIAFDNGNSTIISNLPEGDYEIRVRDTLDCTYNNNGSLVNVPVSVTQPDELVIASTTIMNTSGNGLSNGSVSVDISGGTLDYEYVWVDNQGNTISTTDAITNVTAGNYTLTVTDANGCTITPTEFEITEPEPLTVSAEITNIILCNGDSSGILSATAIGGVPFSNAPNDYSFEWFDASTTEVIGTNAVLDAISAGTYYVVITDANANTTSSEMIEITEPDALIVTLTAEYSLCGDGKDWTITSLITGGISNYNYIWNTGATTPDLSNTLPGEYVLTVSDQFGCVISTNITLIPPPDLVASHTITNATCYGGNDGSIQLTTNGGTPPYMYIWDNGDSADYVSNLEAGNYQVSIIDSKGCEFTETYEITEPTETIIDLGPDITLCLDQTLELDASILDGVTYEWTSDHGFTSSNAQVILFEEGLYTVTATNNLGCIVTDEISVATTQDPINAEFLVSSQVFTNQPFIMVQVSEPFPDTVEWMLPNEATILEMGTDYVELSFDTAGEYELVLMISNGNCTDIQTKKIMVMDGEDFNMELDVSNEPIISSFIVYPNPTSGIFTIETELREELPLSIKIFSINSNAPIEDRYLDGEQFYSENYNLRVPSGVYFALLETANTTLLKKIIIQ